MDLEQRASEERKKWDKPYKFEPYPKMLYRGTAATPGWEHLTVGDEDEERTKAKEGWKPTLPEALTHYERLQADIGQAAAERAASDRRMSAAAQADARKAEEANDGLHLGEVPVTPIKKPLKRTLGPDDLPPEKA
jgi:hypothetical protein